MPQPSSVPALLVVVSAAFLALLGFARVPARVPALLVRLAVLTVAFLLPLVFFLDANEVFELAKSVTLRVFAVAALSAWAAHGAPLRLRSAVAVLAFLAYGVLSQVQAPLLVAGLERLWELGAIVALLWLAESGGVSRTRLLAVVLWSNSLVAVYGLVQYAGFDMINWTDFGRNRVYATMGNPDFLAAQNSFLLPLEFCLVAGLSSSTMRFSAREFFLRPPSEWIARARAWLFRREVIGRLGRAVFLAGAATVGVFGVGVAAIAFVFRDEAYAMAAPFIGRAGRMIQVNPDSPDAVAWLFLVGAAGLLWVILATMARVRRTDVRDLVVAGFLLSLPSILYAQARGALLGFLAAIHAIVWFADRHVFRHRPGQTLVRMAVLDLGLAAALYVTPPGHQLVGRFMEIARDPVTAADLQVRLFYWYSGWRMGVQHPFTGSGLGNFHIAGARSQGESQVIWNRQWPRAAEVVSPHLELYAHNDYVHLFAELGPGGLGLYLWIMVALLATGLAALKRAETGGRFERWLLIGLVAAAVSYYVNSLFNFPLKVTANAHFFYAVIVPVLLTFSRERRLAVPMPRSRWFVAAVWVVSLLLAERACGTLVATYYLKKGHAATEAPQNNPRAGLYYFEKARLMRPVHTDGIVTHYYAARAWDMAGDLDASIRSYTRAIQIFTNFPEARRDRGNAKEEMAEHLSATAPAVAATYFQDALADLAFARVLNPKDPRTLFSIGRTELVLGRPEEALEPFRLAARFANHAPPEADADYGLAMSLLQLRRNAEAKQAVLDALKAEPDHPGARGLLAALKAGRRIPIPNPLGAKKGTRLNN